ncbi:NAD-dependent epimerase/dehydratase family protein [Dictyobacter kobayashii]|uniref:UDP-glucose 4-epimerase n=1 Tax=Dictyobacter kobayashii TaxID=2014872 RepID=A0A402ACB0_9CHLR|nr:NAD-dependent epimerase/dehydratase family protein [Dictyobacter kobayashii]GCE16718.1 hypothetical protein KDK_05180 [Dictyobacter kobayashii]
MRCIVTGGAGFIGGHLVNGLQNCGHEVLSIDILHREMPDKQGVDVDICDSQQLQRVFADFQPQVIFHLAGVADARAALIDPIRAVHINITGTTCVLQAAQQINATRVVIASSCWVYNAMHDGPIDENTQFLSAGGGTSIRAR